MAKKSSKRSQAQKSGFKKTKIPFDRGYVKETQDGGRLHKYGKSSTIHKDKVSPSKNPIGHIIQDVIGLPIILLGLLTLTIVIFFIKT